MSCVYTHTQTHTHTYVFMRCELGAGLPCHGTASPFNFGSIGAGWNPPALGALIHDPQPRLQCAFCLARWRMLSRCWMMPYLGWLWCGHGWAVSNAESWFTKCGEIVSNNQHAYSRILTGNPFYWDECTAMKSGGCHFHYDSALRTEADFASTKKHCLENYERHIERVKQVIPPQKLLVYNWSDGLGSFGAFLGASLSTRRVSILRWGEVRSCGESRHQWHPWIYRMRPTAGWITSCWFEWFKVIKAHVIRAGLPGKWEI